MTWLVVVVFVRVVLMFLLTEKSLSKMVSLCLDCISLQDGK